MNNTGVMYVDKGGNHYDVVLGANGKYYVADPHYTLPGTHKLFSTQTGLPTTNTATPSRVKSGMLGQNISTGQAASSIGQVVGAAATFIPVVGPVVGPLISAVSSIFGGGDPTPLSTLGGNIVQLRSQIAQANIAAGIPDTYQIPANWNPQDKTQYVADVDSIVEEVLGVTEAEIQSNRRADYYSAISALQKELAASQTTASNASLAKTITQQVTQSVEQALAPTSSVGNSASSLLNVSGSAPSPSTLLYTGTPAGTVPGTTGLSSTDLLFMGAIGLMLLLGLS